MEGMGPSEWEQAFRWIERLLGRDVPQYVNVGLGVTALCALIAFMIYMIALSAEKCLQIIKEHAIPLLYSADRRERVRTFRLFAAHLCREIDVKNAAERWRDEEFAELEAEVEAEGRRRIVSLLPRAQGVRRESSLTKALERSAERLVLVEGDPGSGKSVALRHFARRLAHRATRSRDAKVHLPIHVNLKELKVAEGAPINRELIRNFVISSVKRINDRFVDEFIDQEFDAGVKEGRWVFLFDSFDEIPDILSSTSADEVIADYAQAISDFLSGFNQCRAVVASRAYRGPRTLPWKRFTVLPLTFKRQKSLILRALPLDRRLAQSIVAEAASASEEISVIIRNPMLLGLLCEQSKLGHPFPRSAYEVFGRYTEYRFERDALRIQRRFSLATSDVRTRAERVAFVMTADKNLGLSPTLSEIEAALSRWNFPEDAKAASMTLNVLEYMKLGRLENFEKRDEFTFSHRRFQEFFATCVVNGSPDVVSDEDLLTDARWRETAVVMLQTADRVSVQRLVEFMKEALLSYAERLSLIRPSDDGRCEWPPEVFHLLGILHDGLGERTYRLDVGLSDASSNIVSQVFLRGDMLDKRDVLRIAGALPPDDLEKLTHRALDFDSQWLNDAVYRLAGRLANPSTRLMSWMKLSIFRLAQQGLVSVPLSTLYAYAKRLPLGDRLTESARLAVWSKPADAAFVGVASYLSFSSNPDTQAAATSLAFTMGLTVYLVRSKAVQLGGLAFNIRTMLALVVLWASASKTTMDNLWVTAVSALLVTWGGLADWYALYGRAPRPLYWPLLHVISAQAILMTLIKRRPKVHWPSVIKFAPRLFVFILGVALIAYAFLKFAILARVILAILIVLFVSVFLFVGVIVSRDLVHDVYRIARGRFAGGSVLDVYAVAHMNRHLRVDWMAVWYLQRQLEKRIADDAVAALAIMRKEANRFERVVSSAGRSSRGAADRRDHLYMLVDKLRAATANKVLTYAATSRSPLASPS